MDFKPIRNKIKSFSYDSLAILLLNSLKYLEKQDNLTAFWHPLLLLKWTIEFAEDKYPPKIAKKDDVTKMLKKIGELEMSHSTFYPDSYDSLRKSMTILGYQQLMYQELCSWDVFARQVVLYLHCEHKFEIDISFNKLTNLKIIEFLQMLYYIWYFIFRNEVKEIKYYGYVSNNMLAFIENQYGKQKLQAFLDLLMICRENIHSVLESDKRNVRNYNLQPFETSIFTRKPLFLFRDKYYIPHKDVVKHTAKYFLYEFLKSKEESFTTEFGIRMEKYLELGLRELNINYINETELKRTIGRNNNLVDFIVDEQILIEAKAIEMKPYVGTNPTDELLANEFRQNITKAYAKQMLNVIKTMPNNTEYFGIIVTYKKLNLGNASDIWHQFLKEETLKIIDIQTTYLLPIQNLFFIDLPTWDILMQVLKTESISLVQILKDVRQSDSEFKTKKEWFAMHLDKYNIQQLDLEYLKKGLDQITASV